MSAGLGKGSEVGLQSGGPWLELCLLLPSMATLWIVFYFYFFSSELTGG